MGLVFHAIGDQARPRQDEASLQGTVTAQDSVLGSTTLPRSSEASVTVHVKSAAVAAGAPSQVRKLTLARVVGSPPIFTASTLNP